MRDHDHICLCSVVSKRAAVVLCRQREQSVADLVRTCISIGSGCLWCVPYLELLHKQVMDGVEDPDIDMSAEEYARCRDNYHLTGKHDMEL